MARRATLIAQERSKNEAILVLDAGDSLVGDQDPARKTKGQSSITVMNMMNYDAMALGPKDLALGSKELTQRIAQADFTLLSANAVVSATGKLVAKPYLLRPFGAHTLAVVGLSGGKGSADIAVQDPLKAIQATLAEIGDKANVIIVLSHAGAELDQRIADEVEGIDLIISGDAPALATAWRSPKTGTLVVRADQAQTGHAGRVMGVARLTFDATGKLSRQSWQRVSLSPEVADDPAITTWVNKQYNP